jgi:hypothetical protein
MLRNGTDAGTVAAYLRLELERDPMLNMTASEKLTYEIRRLTSTFLDFGKVLWEHQIAAVRAQEHYRLVGPGPSSSSESVL